jgi:hypothetical protein
MGNTYRLGNGPFKFIYAENDLRDESLQIINGDLCLRKCGEVAAEKKVADFGRREREKSSTQFFIPRPPTFPN